MKKIFLIFILFLCCGCKFFFEEKKSESIMKTEGTEIAPAGTEIIITGTDSVQIETLINPEAPLP